MEETEEIKFLYLWRNHVNKTCFGITSNLERRRSKYQGHTGVPVEFSHVWKGPPNLIEDLETKIKESYYEYLFATDIGKYEWINAEVAYNDVVEAIKFEAENSYDNLVIAA